jgi:undecaprenyl-diphosphatase
MDFIWAILLGLLQGVTEFLPVSSSGHLVIAQALIPEFPRSDVLFEVLVHLGTLMAVVVSFRKDIWSMTLSLRPGGEAAQRKIVLWVLLATIPTAVIGFTFQDFFHEVFRSARTAAWMLLVTGSLLWVGEKMARPRRGLESVGVLGSFGVGVVQGLSIMPGISRSGSTIAAATLLGVKGEDAVRLSFLISLPAVAGAALLEGLTASPVTSEVFGAYLVGAVAAFLSGILSIKCLLAVVRNAKLRLFSYYCWSLGIAFLLWGPTS